VVAGATDKINNSLVFCTIPPAGGYTQLLADVAQPARFNSLKQHRGEAGGGRPPASRAARCQRF
jgi:hypothetical protein